MKPKISILALGVVCALGAGCSSVPMDGSTYGSNDMLQQGQVTEGVVVRVQEGMYDTSSGNNSSVGSAAGAALGAMIGNNMSGRGKAPAMLGLGLLGGVAGDMAGKFGSVVPAWNLTIRTASGLTVVHQQKDGFVFAPGQHVYIQNTGGHDRVVPAQ